MVEYQRTKDRVNQYSTVIDMRRFSFLNQSIPLICSFVSHTHNFLALHGVVRRDGIFLTALPLLKERHATLQRGVVKWMGTNNEGKTTVLVLCL